MSSSIIDASFWLFRYDKAAQLYAQTEASFEEVALKFMEVKQEDALQIFLLEVVYCPIINLILFFPLMIFMLIRTKTQTESFTAEGRPKDATFDACVVAA